MSLEEVRVNFTEGTEGFTSVLTAIRQKAGDTENALMKNKRKMRSFFIIL